MPIAFARSSLKLSLLLAVAFAGRADGQTLQHEKYTLDNGLTVILHVDHALPISTINLWYGVGAKNEPAGRSGFAHLFEHLMFMGTKRAPGNTFDTMMEAAGGGNNATTSLDRTNYFSNGPAQLLPLLLWLDADRMEALGTNMTDEKLGKQRHIVQNELRQNIENTPYGRAYDAMFQYLYPVGHPYHNAVGGTHADLEAATVNDVRDFFATFYVPSNCSLVVAGDFDPAVIKPLINNLYGTLPNVKAPRDRAVPLVSLDRVVRVAMLDKVELPKLLIAYHSPPSYKDGDAEAQLVARMLGDGQNARLYKRLVVADQTCVDVSAYQDSGQLQSQLVIDVTAKPGADLAQIERAIDEELATLIAKGPTAAELGQQTAAIELDKVSALQSIQSRADQLNEYQYFYGEPDSLGRDLDRFRHATPDGVQALAKAVLTPDKRLIMTVLPESADAIAPSPRDQIPAASTTQPATFVVPVPERFTLASGATVELFRRPELPLVSATLLAKPIGSITIDPPERAGRSELATAMMSEGTGELDGAAFSAALQTLGAEFDADAHRTGLSTSLTVLDRNFAAAAKLWLDATFRPRMNALDFDRVKTNAINGLEQRDQQPAYVANTVGLSLLYGPGTPFGTPEDGDAESVARLTLDDAASTGRELLSDPRNLTIFLAGNLTREQAIAILDPLLPKAPAPSAAATPASQPAATSPAYAKADGLRVVIVDRPGAPQTCTRFFAPGIVYFDARRVPLELMNIALGGSFTSRLNLNLREQKGYTYGSASRFTTGKQTGWFAASADLKTDVTGPGVKEMLGELKRIAAGDLSAEELVKAQETYRTAMVGRFGTLGSQLATAAGLNESGATLDQLQTDLKAAASSTADALNTVARQTPNLANGILVLVGDEATIREQLKPLDLPPAITVDARGRATK